MSTPTPRQLVEKNLVSSILISGIILATILYSIGAYEACVMFAMVMPGVYWGFAFIAGSWMEVIEETITLALLISVFQYCIDQIITVNQIYYGPLSIGIHGFVDLLHHFQLYPSEKHVQTCCPKYPLLCGLVDFTVCGTMCLLMYLSSDRQWIFFPFCSKNKIESKVSIDLIKFRVEMTCKRHVRIKRLPPQQYCTPQKCLLKQLSEAVEKKL